MAVSDQRDRRLADEDKRRTDLDQLKSEAESRQARIKMRKEQQQKAAARRAVARRRRAAKLAGVWILVIAIGFAIFGFFSSDIADFFHAAVN